MITHTGTRLAKDVRQKYHLLGVEDGDYNPKLYIKSKFVFKNAPEHIEKAIVDFNKAVSTVLRFRRRRRPVPNLTPLSFDLMQFLKENDRKREGRSPK